MIIRRLALWSACVVLGLSLVAWNASRFIGAQPKPRMKDLDFLPSPTAARLLSLGHANTVSRLRWIDSFAYFQLQLERKDDSIASTGDKAFNRLYKMLIGLDPYYLPFYEHASLNLGGVLGRSGDVLEALHYGLLYIPHEVQLWRMTAAELSAKFNWEERQTLAFDGFLAGWEAAMPDQEMKQQVWDWKASMAKRRYKGLEQVPYWEQQLSLATKGTPAYEFVLDTLREQICRFGFEELSAVAAWRAAHGATATSISELTDIEPVRSRHPRGWPPLGPWAADAAGAIRVTADPFGWPYRLASATSAVSTGMELLALRRNRTFGYNSSIAAFAKANDRWPADAAEAIRIANAPEPPVAQARWVWDGQQLRLDVDTPPEPAWEPGR